MGGGPKRESRGGILVLRSRVWARSFVSVKGGAVNAMSGGVFSLNYFRNYCIFSNFRSAPTRERVWVDPKRESVEWYTGSELPSLGQEFVSAKGGAVNAMPGGVFSLKQDGIIACFRIFVSAPPARKRGG